MRNIIGKIYILSLTIITQTGCDKNDRAVGVIKEPGEFRTTAKLQSVRHADPEKSTPNLIDQRGIYHEILSQFSPAGRGSMKATGVH